MHIGILQTGHLPEEIQARSGDYHAHYERWLGGQGLTFSHWFVVDNDFPESIDAAEGWLITGSRHGAYEDLPWIPRLEDFIREIHAAKRPLVGICFGHQIIAQALGGTVEKFGGGWGVGPHDYTWNGDSVTLNAWHQDQVIRAPKDAVTVSSSPFCQHAALVYGDHAMSMQAHPEFTRDTVELLMDTRAPGVVPEPVLKAARDRLDAPTGNARIARQIADFFKEARHG